MALGVFVEPGADVSQALVSLQPLCLFTLLSSRRPPGLLKRRPRCLSLGQRKQWPDVI